MCVDFTIAIPTYNGENRLPQVLEKLQNQVGIDNLNWEILIVDNNSTDGTVELIRQYQATWSLDVPLRYCSESKQGAGFARAKAIQEAKGEIIGFLDDDNLPYANWTIEAYKFAVAHPEVGAYASQIHGAFEIEPSKSIKPLLFYLAITERGEKPHPFVPRKNGFPPSAGLVVRRKVWRDSVPKHLLFNGRVGSSMLGSEDAEVLSYIYRAGWEIWYNPEMVLDHIIPSQRLERNYLISLMRGVGLARYHLRMLQLQSWQRPFASIIYFVNDLRKLGLHFLRFHSAFETDVVAACEMQRLWSTLISPFYLGIIQAQKIFK